MLPALAKVRSRHEPTTVLQVPLNGRPILSVRLSEHGPSGIKAATP